MWFCDECPTPAEIISRRNAIRDAWPKWRRRQARQCEMLGAVVMDTIYTIGTE